jgi:mannitol 2-dehydrogenase
MADILTQKSQAGGTDPKPLLSLTEIFGDLSQSSRFVDAVAEDLRSLYEVGSKATLAQFLQVH